MTDNLAAVELLALAWIHPSTDEPMPDKSITFPGSHAPDPPSAVSAGASADAS